MEWINYRFIGKNKVDTWVAYLYRHYVVFVEVCTTLSALQIINEIFGQAHHSLKLIFTLWKICFMKATNVVGKTKTTNFSKL